MNKLSTDSLAQIFLNARTHSVWLNREVPDSTLKEIYNLMRWAPTSANTSPARIIFVKSKTAKEKLISCMDSGNIEKTRTAPVTAIIAEDMKFYEKLPKLFPHADAKSWFEGNQTLIEKTAFRNSSLQGAYFILAARALGLDCGPMSGFNNQKVDELFLANTSWRSNFMCNIGFGDLNKVYPRSPRLEFEEACRID